MYLVFLAVAVGAAYLMRDHIREFCVTFRDTQGPLRPGGGTSARVPSDESSDDSEYELKTARSGSRGEGNAVHPAVAEEVNATRVVHIGTKRPGGLVLKRDEDHKGENGGGSPSKSGHKPTFGKHPSSKPRLTSEQVATTSGAASGSAVGSTTSAAGWEVDDDKWE